MAGLATALAVLTMAPNSAAQDCGYSFSSPPGPLPNATVGQSYSASVTVSGNPPPAGKTYHWGLDASLPPGLSWDTNGGSGTGLGDTLTISGTPTTTGSYSPGWVVENDSGQGFGCAQSYTWTIAVNNPAPPLQNSAPPLISGSLTSGHALHCDPGTWTGAQPITYTYSWVRDGTTPVGSDQDYTTTDQDVNHLLTCQVTATNSSGSAQATSQSVTVLAAQPPHGPDPVIRFDPTKGYACDPGSWTGTQPISFTYRWTDQNGRLLGTEAELAVAVGAAAKELTCQVTASNSDGTGTATKVFSNSADVGVSLDTGVFFTTEESPSTTFEEMLFGQRGSSPAGLREFDSWWVGDTMNVVATISNLGPDAVSSLKFALDTKPSVTVKYLGYYISHVLDRPPDSITLQTKPIPALLPGQVLKLVYQLRLTSSGPLSFVATVSDVVPTDPNSANNTAQTAVDVRSRPVYSDVKFTAHGVGGDISGKESSAVGQKPTKKAGDPAALAARGAPRAPVEIAVLHRRGAKCSWLKGSSGVFEPLSVKNCSNAIFLRAAGSPNWDYHLSRRPRNQTDLVLVREANQGAKAEAEFAAAQRNLFKIRFR